MFLCSGGCPPGLSIAQASRVSGKNQLKSDMLLTTKVNLLWGNSTAIN